MAHTEDKTKTTEGEKKDKRDTNQLGLSPNTYALGESSKWSLVSLGGITAGLTAVLLGVFREGATNWRNREPILKWLGGIEKGFKSGMGRISNTLMPENKKSELFKGAGPIIALSFGIAIIASHLVQAPTLLRGRVKAKRAIDKYNTLQDENVELEKRLAECEGKPVYTEQTPAGSPAVPMQNSGASPKQFTAAAVPPVSSHVGALQQEKDIPPSIGTGV